MVRIPARVSHPPATALVVASDASAFWPRSGEGIYPCDGTADDVQWEQAWDGLPAGGGKIIGTDGTFSFTTIPTCDKANVLIECQGRATKFTQPASTNLTHIFRFTAAFCGIRDVLIDGNKDNNTSGTSCLVADTGSDDFYMNNVWTINSEGHGLFLAVGIVRWRINNLYCKDLLNRAVNCPNTTLTNVDGYISGVYVEGNVGFGVGLQFCSNFVVDRVIGTVPTETTNEPVNIDSCQNFVVAFCSVRGSLDSGIVIDNDSDGACKNGTVVGNSVVDTNLDGILIVDSGTNNTTDIVVSGNTIKSCGKADAAVYAGIHLKDGVTDCVVTGNRCFDDTGTKVQDYGIMESGGSDFNLIANNDVRGNLTDGINGSAIGANTIVRDNLGFTQNAGTANTGVTATEVSDGNTFVTTLAVSQVNALTLGDNEDLADGYLLYTFPSGVVVIDYAYMTVAVTAAGSQLPSDQPDVGLGTVIATGANALLSAVGTYENIITGQTAANASGTATVKTANPTAGAPFIIETGEAHTLHFNVADGWANDTGGDLTADIAGTVVIKWSFLA